MAMVSSFSWIWLSLLTLLLPQSPAGKPTPAKTMLQHVAPDAQVVMTVDLGAFGGQMLQEFTKLGKDPLILQTPPISRGHRMMLRSIKRSLRKVKRRFGVDVLRDVNYLTLMIRQSPVSRRMDFALVIGGNFQPDVEGKLRRINRTKAEDAVAVGSFRLYVSTRRRRQVFAWSNQTIILGSNPAFIRGALAGASVSPLAKWMATHANKPSMINVGVQPSSKLARLFGRSRMIYDLLLKDNAMLGMSLLYKGSKAIVKPRNATAALRAKYLFDGVGTLMTAGAHGMTGLLKIADGVLSPSDTSLPMMMRFIAANKKPLFTKLYKHISASKVTHSVTKDANGNIVLEATGNGSAGMLLGSTASFAVFGLAMGRRSRRYNSYPKRVSRRPVRAYARPAQAVAPKKPKKNTAAVKVAPASRPSK
ncbi:MAG TPA: hypothetical protein DCE42_29255 [Myxococcales bacterium]|nr:hypothetical protein [Deltaproteobacteria bacterium]HAA58887.1 hypothetical protein [Myxococcales bacterium]|tara:strand:+ start:3679 stop:4938 length:1260 start_codon:yes stop_codon:yes gene_type:complete